MYYEGMHIYVQSHNFYYNIQSVLSAVFWIQGILYVQRKLYFLLK